MSKQGQKIYIMAESDAPAAQIRSPLGMVAKDVMGSATASEVMERAGLNWRVTKEALFTEAGLEVPSHVAIKRSDNDMILGVVGAGYEPLQNAEAFSFADSLVDQGAMDYVGAGLFNDGGRIFIQAKVHHPGNGGDGGVGLTEIVPGEAIQPYFFLANGHDGSLAVRVQMVNTRVVCQNTFAMALREGRTRKENSVSLKHTKNLGEKLEQTRTLLTWAGLEFSKFISAARDLTKKQMNRQQVDLLFSEAFKVEAKEDDRSEAIKNRRIRLLELFEAGAGQDNKYVRGTAWAAVNAVTQYLTHEARTSVRGGDKLSDEDKAKAVVSKRFESNLLGNNRRIAEVAMELALAA